MSDAIVSRVARAVHRQTRARDTLERILGAADIAIDGTAPCDIRVHDDRFFMRVMTLGTLGLGESYMDGWWDCPCLDEMTNRALGNDVDDELIEWRDWLFVL